MNFFVFGDKQRIRTHNLLQFMNQLSSVKNNSEQS